MNKKSLITLLVAGATLLPLRLYSQEEGYLPKEIRGIKLSEGEISYFEQMQNTPELLKEKRNAFLMYEDYFAAIDYTKKAMVFAYSRRDNNMYSNLSRDLTDLTKEYNFIKSMNFGIFSTNDGKIAVYNYINSNIEDSTKSKKIGLIQGRRRLFNNQKQNFSKFKKYQIKDEEVKIMNSKDKTIYMYIIQLGPEKLNESILKSLKPLPKNNPLE